MTYMLDNFKGKLVGFFFYQEICLKDTGSIALLPLPCALTVTLMNSVNSGKFIKDSVIKTWSRCNNREKPLNSSKHGVRR